MYITFHFLYINYKY